MNDDEKREFLAKNWGKEFIFYDSDTEGSMRTEKKLTGITEIGKFLDENGTSWNYVEPIEVDQKQAYRDEVEQANRDGEEIQFSPIFLDLGWADRLPESMVSPLNWSANDYRIKPKPKYIPYTVKTIPKGVPFREKDWADGMCFIPITYMLNGFICFDPDHIKSYQTYYFLLKNCEHLDGTPCGTLEEEN